MREHSILAFAAWLVVLGLMALPADAAQTVRADHVTFDVAFELAVRPSSTVWIAIRQMIDPTWHTYWRNPGDTGLATSITWELPSGVTAGQPQWPVPERFTTGPIVNFGYRDEATTLVPLHINRDAHVGDFSRVKLFLLECQQMCIPENVSLDLDLRGPPGPFDLFKRARAALPKPFGGSASFAVDAKDLILTLRDPALRRANPVTAEFYPATNAAVDYDARPEFTLSGDTLTLKASRSPRAKTISGFEGVLSVPGAGAFAISA